MVLGRALWVPLTVPAMAANPARSSLAGQRRAKSAGAFLPRRRQRIVLRRRGDGSGALRMASSPPGPEQEGRRCAGPGRLTGRGLGAARCGLQPHDPHVQVLVCRGRGRGPSPGRTGPGRGRPAGGSPRWWSRRPARGAARSRRTARPTRSRCPRPARRGTARRRGGRRPAGRRRWRCGLLPVPRRMPPGRCRSGRGRGGSGRRTHSGAARPAAVRSSSWALRSARLCCPAARPGSASGHRASLIASPLAPSGWTARNASSSRALRMPPRTSCPAAVIRSGPSKVSWTGRSPGGGALGCGSAAAAALAGGAGAGAGTRVGRGGASGAVR